MTIPSVSRIPTAIDGLHALLTAGFVDVTVEGLPIHILDGPPVSPIASPHTVLLIGAGGSPDDVRSAEGVVDAAGMDNGMRETFELACHLEHWRGGDDLKKARDTLFEVLDLVGAVIASDRTLSGAVTRSRIVGALELAQSRFKGDSGAAVPFSVRCDVA